MKAIYMQIMDLYLIFQFFQGTFPWQPNNVAVNKFAKMLSTPTDTTCICCTSGRKRIAVSWSSYAHYRSHSEMEWDIATSVCTLTA